MFMFCAWYSLESSSTSLVYSKAGLKAVPVIKYYQLGTEKSNSCSKLSQFTIDKGEKSIWYSLKAPKIQGKDKGCVFLPD